MASEIHLPFIMIIVQLMAIIESPSHILTYTHFRVHLFSKSNFKSDRYVKAFKF